MEYLLSYPRIFFVCSFLILWLAARVGAFLHRRRSLTEEERADFGNVETATLTLLGLIIGFSFAMAITRYDQRKNYEEAEANAIGTEFVRADLLPPADGARVRGLLTSYLDLRILFYTAVSDGQLQHINADTSQLQGKMWSAVQVPASAQPTSVVALAVAGMNDVLNSQGYTQAIWWNRIPVEAWTLMIAIAVLGNALVGYGARPTKARNGLLFVLPLIVSISFLLIADIDSPRTGFVRVIPQNLRSLSQSLPRQ